MTRLLLVMVLCFSRCRPLTVAPPVSSRKRAQVMLPDPVKKEQVMLPDETNIGSLKVPNLAIGTISWTKEGNLYLPGDKIKSRMTKETQRDIAQLALDKGLTFFDTAERYSVGAGESLLAEALGDGPGVVATKFTPGPWRMGPESVVAACEASRQRLKVDQIDLYQLHMPDIVQPLRMFGYVNEKDEAYWEGLARCVELGLVKEVGVSNYGPTLLKRCHSFLKDRGINLASNQIHYSLLARHRGHNQATVDAAKALNVTTLAYYPLARGLLTSKKGPGSLAHYAQGGVGYIGAPWLEKNRIDIPSPGVEPLVDALEVIAHKYSKTVSQIALNWIIANGVVPIVGTTTEAYLLDALGALGWRISDEDQAFLEQAADDLGFEFQGTFFKRVDGKFVGYGVERWELD